VISYHPLAQLLFSLDNSSIPKALSQQFVNGDKDDEDQDADESEKLVLII